MYLNNIVKSLASVHQDSHIIVMNNYRHNQLILEIVSTPTVMLQSSDDHMTRKQGILGLNVN